MARRFKLSDRARRRKARAHGRRRTAMVGQRHRAAPRAYAAMPARVSPGFSAGSSRRHEATMTMMRNMKFAGTTPDGQMAFVATSTGRGTAAKPKCPTGEECSEACVCSGVSASGVVGVGASCKCVKWADLFPPAGAAPRHQSTFKARGPGGGRVSPGYTAGARSVMVGAQHMLEVGRRVPPPGRPHGRLGGHGRGTAYRYPGSGRRVMVGQKLQDVGRSKCVPCSKAARMARG